MKPGTPVLRSTRLLDQVRERIRYLHYSLQTEKAYLHWVRFFICWHGRDGVMHLDFDRQVIIVREAKALPARWMRWRLQRDLQSR